MHSLDEPVYITIINIMFIIIILYMNYIYICIIYI